MLGSSFTRLQQEFLPRLVDGVIHILQKRGLMPKITVRDKEIKVRYKSPLTISQGQSDVAVATQWLQLMQGVYGPEVASTYLHPIEFPYWMADKMGVEQKVLNTKEGMEQVLAQQSELAQEVEISQIDQLTEGAAA